MAKKKDKKDKIVNLIIMDASSSMYGKKQEVFDGLNQVIKDTKKMNESQGKQKHEIIITQFSSPNSFNVIRNEKAKKCEVLEDGEYNPNGMTALYDGIMKSFDLIPKDADGAVITIFTDGQENSSQEATIKDCEKLIKKARKDKWSVMFMGCSEDSIKAAQSMGVAKGSSFSMADSGEGFTSGFNARKVAFGTYSMNYVDIQSGDLNVDDILDNDQTENSTSKQNNG